MNRAAIIAEAMEWVGTPYQANQRTKGVGADCIGMVSGVALAIGLPVPGLTTDYSRKPDGRMQPYLDTHLDRVAGEPRSGDVLLMSFAGEPHHVAVLVGGGRIVHAYATVRKCVVQSYTDFWREKVRAVYQFPGVE